MPEGPALQTRLARDSDESLEAEPHIWAGIVTYNPDIHRLRQNVAAIAPQAERLLVFDNGSKNVDEAKRAVPEAVFICSSKNLGMSKALNRLAQVAADSGATDIVFLDQDSIAAGNLINEESKNRGDDVGLICPLVVDRTHSGVEIDENRILEVKRPITSGSMVSLAAWQRVGGYDERLFVDWVDNEFCDNLRVHNFRIIKTCRTHILHEMGHQVYAWSAPGKDDAGQSHAMRGYYRQNYPAWRWRDRARSQAITIQKYGLSRIGWEERYYFLRATLARILFLEEHKLKNLRAIASGVKSAHCRQRYCNHFAD